MDSKPSDPLKQARHEEDQQAKIRQRSAYLELLDASLEYRLLGPTPDQAPTIILMHEGLGCVALWKDFPERLSALTGCGLFVYSRRGYGQSSPYPPPWPTRYMHDEASILNDVLNHLNIQSGIICGHSDGASIAAIYQGTYAHPKVHGLVLIAPHFFAEEIGLKAIHSVVNDFHNGELRERLEAYHEDNVENAFLGWSGAWLHKDFVSWNIEAKLANIRVPILAIQGEQDPYGTVDQVNVIRGKAAGKVDITLLPDCGHAPHIEEADRVLKEIGRFVTTTLKI
jgi:pimeloyl-ACP methyl ester carboxylesterase